MLIIYNLLFPLVFLFFLPGLLWKLWRRPGWKKTFGERFGSFSKKRFEELSALQNVVWIHSVSVGETMIALALLKEWREQYPNHDFVLSTTTTTGQALAREKAPDGVKVIFCPIDFINFVSRTVLIIKPKILVILETEIWPNLIWAVKTHGAKVALINGRMSDHSMRGYRRFRFFFAPTLRRFDLISVQTPVDAERYWAVCADAKVKVNGNLKFDQQIPDNLAKIALEEYFGPGQHLILLAASTHPGEEALICGILPNLLKKFPPLKLILIPRHAERGSDVAAILKKQKLKFCRRSLNEIPAQPVDCLLADTTGEMLSFMKAADIVIMGKSLAGQNEGHNLIEPALLGKPIITGAVLKNFRFVLETLKNHQALALVDNDSELENIIARLLDNPDLRTELGRKAHEAIAEHKGAVKRNIEQLEEMLK
ncbi:MAG: 3-deoxy-D-manno-octulosonic acid transferase [Victivallaceae bacterium]|nr:3-deoxy-D-manno-octulosonic acid transferase [Victivallaceae bacterium]NLK82572.1 3-deoxy-D-manno-octulosonic acid transferase [Lentisphaerota bacterium]MDD3115828.1 3-deoxy-D-manno-octulosonic acid transferase [Victivallaceae bacterium]MDD3703033.1 3-deoxy-D-manno-octulosonic acid transferase [Victivallaceae bacterium]MDD4316901.1 3-deoxy-D-manno-octulosonic acid transferase [Victivallaceae bacterium]